LLVFGTVIAGQPQKFKNPSTDPSNWNSTFYVLLKDDASLKKTQKTIEKIMAKDTLDIPLGAFKKHLPVSVSTFLPMGLSKKNDKDKEDARSKLGRYLIVRYYENDDLSAIFNALKTDPDVAYFSVDEITPVISHHQDDFTGTITEDISWGFDFVRANQAHFYQQGHALIGIADLGLDQNHVEFTDYSGNTWLGGNFHPASAFNVGQATTETGPNANPYHGHAIFGDVDAYHLGAVNPLDGHPADNSCDGPDANNTHETFTAGHGSHVTGIVAANTTNNTGVKGVCEHCPLAIAQFNFPTAPNCFTGLHPDGSPFEGASSFSQESVFGSIGFLIDIGAQVINYSGGIPFTGDNHCDFNTATNQYDNNSALCLIVQYAVDRNVLIVAAAGNDNLNLLNFPASDRRVFGISGLMIGGGFWNEFTGVGGQHGSNFGTNVDNGPTFSAPARDVYSTMYSGKQYNFAVRCDDLTDGVEDGYGYCTGTSMSAPFITGVAGLVKSTNPLAENDEIRAVMKNSTTQSGYSNTLGWGAPRADYAVKDVLGTSGGAQVLNRVTPLFSMYSSVAGDIAQTTKPQVAMSYHLSTVWGYTPYTSESIVTGYTFPESPDNPPPAAARADLYILTTHREPANGRPVVPLYRMSYVGAQGGNSNNADWVLALESEISGSYSFKAVGYEMEGIEGYIYTICAPENTCIPDGAVIVWRAYNSQKDDHAIFPETKRTYMQSIGYSSDLKKLGYAYPNVHSDSDGVIDGMEYILGTDPNTADSDCDGISDGAEYPMTGMPVSDPMDGTCSSSSETPWGSNAGTPTGLNTGWNRAMGYHFTPNVDGQVTKLGGYFNGTKTVRLFNKTTGVLLATTTVSSSNGWSYNSITPPVAVVTGTTYTVAAYINGSGASDKVLAPPDYFPQTYGNITIKGSTHILTTSNPSARPTNNITARMYGQADITFVPD